MHLAGHNATLDMLSVLSARLTKGGELEAATARAVFLALQASVPVQPPDADLHVHGVGQHQPATPTSPASVLLLSFAQLLAKELAVMEASSSGAEHGSPLRSDTQLRLAEAVVRHCQAAAAAAAAAVSLRATLQDKSPRARLRPTELLLPHAGLGDEYALFDAAIAGWRDGWSTGLFSDLAWGDRLRLLRFALTVGRDE